MAAWQRGVHWSDRLLPLIKRLGMLVPSSNTVAEPGATALLPADGSVSLHVARVRIVAITDAPASLAQFDPTAFLEPAELLSDAQCDLILWNGTAASWLGFECDDQLVRTIEGHTGIRTTTALLAMNAALARLGARRIALVTPYVEPLEARIIENYAAVGISVVSAVRADLTENTAFAQIAPKTIGAMVRAAARPGVDAVLIMCTNLAGATLAAPLERELGIPVLDSVRVAVLQSRALLGG